MHLGINLRDLEPPKRSIGYTYNLLHVKNLHLEKKQNFVVIPSWKSHTVNWLPQNRARCELNQAQGRTGRIIWQRCKKTPGKTCFFLLKFRLSENFVPHGLLIGNDYFTDELLFSTFWDSRDTTFRRWVLLTKKIGRFLIFFAEFLTICHRNEQVSEIFNFPKNQQKRNVEVKNRCYMRTKLPTVGQVSCGWSWC